MFLFCLILGVVGLILIALPGLNHHSSIGGHHGLHIGSHSAGHSEERRITISLLMERETDYWL